MHEEPTAYRVPDPGVRALFTEPARYQAWLDVEAALALAQAELGVIPEHAAREIAAKARLSLLDMDAIRSGLARTGHSLVPLIWELDRVCDGDAGGYVHWVRLPRTSPRPVSFSSCAARMAYSSRSLERSSTRSASSPPAPSR
jgi:hypothetical protein